MQKNIFVFFALLLSCFSLSAQQELGTHFLTGTWQSGYTNPALLPNAKFVISVPGFYNNLSISNITFNDLVTEDNSGNKVLDINGAINKMEDQNLLREDFSFETLGLGLKLGKLSLSFNHALKFKAFLDYPKTLPQLIWQGNAQFIGQKVAFGPDVELSAWHHYALGAGFELTDNITIGGRVKFLSGIAHASTEKHDLSLTTSDDIYQLQLDADLLVNASGSLEFQDFENYSFTFDPAGTGFKNLFSSNKGIAFDLGVSAQFGKLDVAASILDIGKINWEKDVKNYAVQGIFEYQGLEVAQEIFADSTEIGSVIDTLKAIYMPVTTSNKFSTALPTQFYLSAGYQLGDNLHLGALFYAEMFRGTTYPAFALSGRYKISGTFEVGAIYAIRNKTFDNLGVNAVINLGPVQLVAMTDNLLTAINPKNSHSANVRLGLNVVLGKEKGKSGGPLNLY
ncbi:MAG: hypothetical protein KDC85_09040 [Saprospiraceae bacterium]|nr:hypothetical protein [Saprospiraceae bacterium]MCB9324808.1 hypothetical protein [Lewinellaceae bacterium]